MSTAFTDPWSGATPIVLLLEIIQALVERDRFLSALVDNVDSTHLHANIAFPFSDYSIRFNTNGGTPGFSPANDWCKGFAASPNNVNFYAWTWIQYRSAQLMVERLAYHATNPCFIPPGGTSRYADLAAFFAAAGMDGSGANRWRRLTAWDGSINPTWSFGYAQYGDIIGPWIFEDLQRCLSIMTAGIAGGVPGIGTAIIPSALSAAAVTRHERIWPAAWTTTNPAFPLVANYRVYAYEFGGIFDYRLYDTFTWLDTIDIGVEVTLSRIALQGFFDLPPASPVGAFYDFDSLGATEDSYLWFEQTPGAANDWPSGSQVQPSTIYIGGDIRGTSHGLIAETEFTNANP